VLAIVGVVVQGTHLNRAKRSMRQQWYGPQYVPAQPR
jgi:hypothetical protein